MSPEQDRIRSKIAKALAEQAKMRPERSVNIQPNNVHPASYLESPKTAFAVSMLGVGLAFLGMGYPMIFPGTNVYLGSLICQLALTCFVIVPYILLPWNRRHKTVGAIVVLVGFSMFSYFYFIRSYRGLFCYVGAAMETTDPHDPLRLFVLAPRGGMSGIALLLFDTANAERQSGRTYRTAKEAVLAMHPRMGYFQNVYKGPVATGLTIEPRNTTYQIELMSADVWFLETMEVRTSPLKIIIDVITSDGRKVWHGETSDSSSRR